jgi:4-amino-4-deoxy-L-arabinose transferase-like glycosyltransferase
MVNKLKLTKENIGIALILILSAILNFANIGIEGYGNSYYAAGVKSMTMSLKNFFFVSFDPGSFVTIDKPPMGFWIQAIFAKIFGFSGWSILLPQALAGVISVYLLYYLVKRSFGSLAGSISALCLAVTPVFVAASRNNTIDNLLVVTLLFACLALTKAAEAGKAKYLYISLLLVGIGFNIKMLEAYMIGPAIYLTYLLSTTISLKKRIGRLAIGTVILFAVSLSWAIAVDLTPAQNRPYVGSSTNNSELELIIGHNGLERLGLSGRSNGGPGGRNNGNWNDGKRQSSNNTDINDNNNKTAQGVSNGTNQGRMQGVSKDGSSQEDGNNQRMPGNIPNGEIQGKNNIKPSAGGMPVGGPGSIQGSFGGQTKAGITRLFSKNSLSDQIVWFLPLALLGFLAGAIKEKLRFKLDNTRKLSLVLWITWLVPEFIYFSYTTGLFHPYYLTMMAPPAAALAGIGISTMWEFYKEGTYKAWFLPIAFAITGATHMMMRSYFTSNLSVIMENIILASVILCFTASAILAALNILTSIKKRNNIDLDENKYMKVKKALMGIAIASILITPFIGASATITHSLDGTIPTAGLELLSNGERGNLGGMPFALRNSVSTSKLINFLENNKTNEKYLLVVSSSQSADSIIMETGEPVMALGGFSGSDNILTLDEFKEMVKNGEVRYVLAGGRGPGGSNEIMNWVTENGTVVPESEYKDTVTNMPIQEAGTNEVNDKTSNKNNNQGLNRQNFGGNNSEQLYDLKDLAVK